MDAGSLLKLVFGCWLLVVGRWKLIEAGCWLLVAGSLLKLVAGRWSLEAY